MAVINHNSYEAWDTGGGTITLAAVTREEALLEMRGFYPGSEEEEQTPLWELCTLVEYSDDGSVIGIYADGSTYLP